MDWYYAQGRQRQGPVTSEQFHQLVMQGQVLAQTLVWHEGLADWQPLRQVVGGADWKTEFESFGADGAAFCNRCGRYARTEDLIEFGSDRICAACKEPFFQSIRQGTAGVRQVVGLAYAGFWIRFAAYMIDYFLLFIPLQILTYAIETPFWMPLVSIVCYMLYDTLFLGSVGATPGKMALGLTVVKHDGSRFGYGRALGRYWARVLSGLILSIGYIIAGFDEQKRALHDHICSTRVVYKRSLAAVGTPS